MHPMRVGLCGPVGPWSKLAFDLVRASGAGTIKLDVTQSVPIDMKALLVINPQMRIILRSHDSTAGGRKKGAEEWAWECIQDVNGWIDALFKMGYSEDHVAVQLDNEPNAKSAYGPDGAWLYRGFLHEALDIMLQRLDPRARVYIAPLASTYEHKLNAWLDVYGTMGDDGLGNLYGRFHGACVNEYWRDKPGILQQYLDRNGNGVAPEMLYWGVGALHIGYAERFPDKDLIITEGGNALGSLYRDRSMEPPERIIEGVQWEQYPVWFETLASAKNVSDGCLFTLPGYGWHDYHLRYHAARNLGRWAIRYRPPAVSSSAPALADR